MQTTEQIDGICTWNTIRDADEAWADDDEECFILSGKGKHTCSECGFSFTAYGELPDLCPGCRRQIVATVPENVAMKKGLI